MTPSETSPGTLRRFALFAFVALAVYGAWLVRLRVRNPGGSDSSGYLNAARLFAEGRTVIPIEPLQDLDLPLEDAPLFIPLGFKAGRESGTMVPYYPPGFPLQLLAAAEVAGWSIGPYLVSPLAAIVSIVLVFLISRELGLGLGWSVIASAILASFSTFLFQAVQVMSDVPATAWSCAAIWFALRSRRDAAWSLGTGVALGVAVLVRPTNAFMAIPVFIIIGVDWRRLALACAGGMPFASMFLVYNSMTFGDPLMTGYSSDLASGDLHFAFFPARFIHYGSWMLRLLSPLVPFGWLIACVSRRVAPRIRFVLVAWVLPTFLFYCLYRHFNEWWYTRFLLPVTPAIIIGAMFFGRDVLGLTMSFPTAAAPRAVMRTVLSVALLVLVYASMFSAIRALEPMTIGDGETAYRDSYAVARFRLPDNAYVLSMQTSGTLIFYGDLHPVRWDLIDDDRLARLESRFARRGLHWYALLFPFEVEELGKHAPGNWKKVEQYRQVTLWVRE